MVAAPLYLWSIYTIPFRVNSDEVLLMVVERGCLSDGVIDLFGVSDYLGFMYFPFLIQGWCAQWLGDVNFYHLRLLSAICGLAIVGFSFIFFRMFGLRWLMALSASVFITANHSFLDISRIASRTNGGLLGEMLALYFLFAGVKNKSRLATYIGGVLTGFCFYLYYSARMTLPVWIIFLLALFLARRRSPGRVELVRSAFVFAFGFSLAVLPAGIAHTHMRAGTNLDDCLVYQKEQCLLYPEGRNLCMNWTQSKTVQEGIMKNILNGLTLFNNIAQDQAFMYQNPGNGFVDPLSGILLWFGFIWVLFRLRGKTVAKFMLSGFLFEWLFYTFITSEVPNYTRLLVTLPFAGYFVANGIESISVFLSRQLMHRKDSIGRTINGIVFPAANLFIVAWNLAIFYNYANWDLVHGDDIGGTLRYLEARQNEPDYLYILAACQKFPYFAFENPNSWKERIEPFMTAKQDCKVWGPDDVTAIKVVPPFTIFMDGDLWQLKQERLTKMYPHLVVHTIFSQRGLVAVEDGERMANYAHAHLVYRHWNDYPDRCSDKLSNGRQDEVVSLCLDVLNAPEARVNGSYFRSQILLTLGTAYLKKKMYKQAASPLLEALRIREQLIGKTLLETAAVTDALGELYKREGDWGKAESYYRESVAIGEAHRQAQANNSATGLARSYKFLAQTLVAQERFEEAGKTFQKSLSSVGRAELDERSDILRELASYQRVLLDRRKKITSLETDIARTTAPDALANLYARLGFEYMKQEDYPQARLTYSLAIKTKLPHGIPKRDEVLAQIYAERGFVNSKLKNYSEAEQDYDLALKLSSAKFAIQNHYARDRQYARDQKMSLQFAATTEHPIPGTSDDTN
jgi:tetratricopeptide (TPR) repeat protein